MKTFFWTVSAVIGLILAGIIFTNFSPDYGLYVVRSESMKPTLNMGDMIITGPLGGPFSREVKTGVIVTYQLGKTTVSHRVLSSDGNTLMTKGDAVKNPDPQLVSTSQVKGVYLFKIPKLGYLSAFIHTKLGWLLLVILPAALLEAFIVKEIIEEALSGSTLAMRRR
jgi:signal peptidase I